LKKPSDIRVYAAGDRAPAAFVLAHGAGAGHDHPFMVTFAKALRDLGLDVVTFNFNYIEDKRKIPDRGPVLEETYRTVIESVRNDLESARRALFIGGKSMGGRIATQVAAADASLPVAGLVLLGYPLHPPGRPEQLRTAHLPRIRVPLLIVQGERDSFGTPDELRPVLAPIASQVTLHVVEKGDHALTASRRADVLASTYGELQDVIARWITAKTRS
jgi:predicted alpha/beta-hydrolase family hydrolase